MAPPATGRHRCPAPVSHAATLRVLSQPAGHHSPLRTLHGPHGPLGRVQTRGQALPGSPAPGTHSSSVTQRTSPHPHPQLLLYTCQLRSPQPFGICSYPGGHAPSAPPPLLCAAASPCPDERGGRCSIVAARVGQAQRRAGQQGPEGLHHTRLWGPLTRLLSLCFLEASPPWTARLALAPGPQPQQPVSACLAGRGSQGPHSAPPGPRTQLVPPHTCAQVGGPCREGGGLKLPSAAPSLSPCSQPQPARASAGREPNRKCLFMPVTPKAKQFVVCDPNFLPFFSEHNKARDNSPPPPRQTETICLHWLQNIPGPPARPSPPGRALSAEQWKGSKGSPQGCRGLGRGRQKGPQAGPIRVLVCVAGPGRRPRGISTRCPPGSLTRVCPEPSPSHPFTQVPGPWATTRLPARPPSSLSQCPRPTPPGPAQPRSPRGAARSLPWELASHRCSWSSWSSRCRPRNPRFRESKVGPLPPGLTGARLLLEPRSGRQMGPQGALARRRDPAPFRSDHPRARHVLWGPLPSCSPACTSSCLLVSSSPLLSVLAALCPPALPHASGWVPRSQRLRRGNPWARAPWRRPS